MAPTGRPSRLPFADRSLVDALVFTVGLLSLLGAVLVTFGGGLAAPLVGTLAPLFGPGFVALGGLLAGGLAVYSAYERSTAERPTRLVSVPTPPSRREDGHVETAGGRLDRLLEEVHADDLEDDVSRVDASVNRKRVRDRIRRVAIDALRETENLTAEEAAERLETGAWTDRPRARVFLGTDVPRLPLSVRLRDWASGEGFRRRASAAIEEIATTTGVDFGESISPPPVGMDEADLERDPVDWPPEPEPTDESETLDRLLEQPVEEAQPATGSELEPQPTPDPGPDPDSGPADDVDVFRREVIPGDAPGNTAADTTEATDAETERGERR